MDTRRHGPDVAGKGWMSRLLPFMASTEPKGAGDIAWNILVAGLAVGGGYLAVRFAGGEEEFEQIPAEPPVNPNMLMGRQMNYPSQDAKSMQQHQILQQQQQQQQRGLERGMDSYESMDEIANSSVVVEQEEDNDTAMVARSGGGGYFGNTPAMKPEWVNDLLTKLEQVDTKLDQIKESLDKQRAQKGRGGDGGAACDDDYIYGESSDDNNNNKITRYYKRATKTGAHMTRFEKAIRGHVRNLSLKTEADGSGKDQDQAAASTNHHHNSLEACLGALIMYLSKILEQPSIPRYRRITVANQTFKTMIAPVVGHDELLQSLGFVKKSTCFEWAEPAAAAAAAAAAVANEDGADGDNDKKGQGGKDKSDGDDEGETIKEVTSLGREDRLALLEKSIELLKARQAGR